MTNIETERLGASSAVLGQSEQAEEAMTDNKDDRALVKSLREAAEQPKAMTLTGLALLKAAATIERLTAERDKWMGDWMALSQDDGKKDREIERLTAEMAEANKAILRVRTERDGAWSARRDAIGEAEQLRARVAELERHLEAIAWRVEPHWKGAGAKLESSWIIKEYNAKVDSLSFVEDRLDELQADLSRAREANLPKLYQMCHRHAGMPWPGMGTVIAMTAPTTRPAVACPVCEAALKGEA